MVKRISDKSSKSYFNSDLYADNTLKKFNEFIQAQHQNPSKLLMDAAIKRRELTTQDKKLDMNHYNNIRTEWIQKDMITKFIDIFSA